MHQEPTYTQYFAIFLFIAIALLFPAVALLIGRLLRPHRPDPAKLTPFECGMEPVGDARERYPVRYYVIALLFLIFAVIYTGNSPAVTLFLLLEMVVFFAIVIIGYVYIWKKGALKWV